MSHAPEFLFSHRFAGRVWNTLADESANLLLLEVRDDVNFLTTFSLFDYGKNEFLFTGVSLPERWWVSLAAVHKDTVLLNRFMNKGGNPDQKSLIALNVPSGMIRWEVESFSFFDRDETQVLGYRTTGEITRAAVDLATGEVSDLDWKPVQQPERAEHLKPVFYPEGSAHFNTVKEFLRPTDYTIVNGVEYLEFGDWIIMSVYVAESGKLANYLLVFCREGTCVLTVKLGENLAGLGADTFFILSGCLFLVRNKTDLAAYRL